MGKLYREAVLGHILDTEKVCVTMRDQIGSTASSGSFVPYFLPQKRSMESKNSLSLGVMGGGTTSGHGESTRESLSTASPATINCRAALYAMIPPTEYPNDE